MGKINLLDLETTNKIAAGEVIERPFSVVKELVENSIDAKAKNITVEIENGGQSFIKIIDDGEGIYKEDMKKAFLPHATSKISNIEDIYKIDTMGFRGEALASISSVSKIKLKSRTKDCNCGNEISIEGGEINYIKDAPSNVGTTIEVRDLFFNVPARLKFLKSTRSDSSYISDIMNRFILAHKDIAFTLISNGKTVVKSYGSGNLKDSIRVIYGKKIAENLIGFENSNDIFSIHGFVGKPDISRKSRNNQSIFVNKRYVKSRFIATSIEKAFKSFLTVSSYPFFVIFIDIFPEYIDVNVHPTKSEVKFKDEGFIFKTIFDTVHEALKVDIKGSFKNFFKDSDETEHILNSNVLVKENIETIKENIQIPIDLNNNLQEVNKNDTSGNNVDSDNFNIQDYKLNVKKEFKDTTYKSESLLNNSIKEDVSKFVVEKEEYTSATKNNFESMKIIGQFNNTYILIEKQEELYMIDQHAAHEKVLFEKFTKEIENKAIVSQLLIAPVVLELTENEFNLYKENKDIFKDTGFSIDEFGENTVSIREIPLILKKPNIENMFMDILYNLKEIKVSKTFKEKYNSIAQMACKAAVKAHDKLSDIEIERLIEDITKLENPFTCPHGRPTIIKFTLKEIEKKFKRIV
ncbi:DNA mismatch repair endonuclease MutL [Clostridium niameyense]|uniref:DNA mismatch repair endonuclease MutL n=1 Tax=Clostridium niameyense TaxID=1622073 RepID=UPI00067E7302|nr:DNA mismatch repair endonuclease MutL [Clostridium niameyense]